MARAPNIIGRYEFIKKSTDFFERIKALNFIDDFENLAIKPCAVSGAFSPKRIDELISFCKNNPKYHIISMCGSAYYNYFRPNAGIYLLADGDTNPRIAYDFGLITIADILRIAEFYRR